MPQKIITASDPYSVNNECAIMDNGPDASSHGIQHQPKMSASQEPEKAAHRTRKCTQADATGQPATSAAPELEFMTRRADSIYRNTGAAWVFAPIPFWLTPFDYGEFYMVCVF